MSSSSVLARPLVSVIVPVFNSERFVGDCLRSVLAQDIHSIEVIVVDDGSTDGTPEIVRSFDARVTYLRQQNSGSAVARNRGLEQARGTFIAFCDSDDLWVPDRLAQQVSFLTGQSEYQAVAGAFKAVPEDFGLGEYGHSQELAPPRIDPTRSGWAYLWLLRDSLYHLDALLVRRETLANVRFNPAYRRGQDFDFLLQLSQVTPIAQLHDLYAFYRQHSGSITRRPHARNYRAEIIQQAVGRWGLEARDGTRMSQAELHTLLGASWFSHGWELYQARWYLESMKALRRSIGFAPLRWSAYRMWLQALVLRWADRMPAQPRG